MGFPFDIQGPGSSRNFLLHFLYNKAIEDGNQTRRNISIGIPLDLSIPTEMTSIEPLVENEKSSKTIAFC